MPTGNSTKAPGWSGLRRCAVWTLEPAWRSRSSTSRRCGPKESPFPPGRLVQLTYTTGRAMRYRLPGLEPEDPFVYPGEGWGLVGVDDGYVMSDGSDELRLLDSRFELQSKLRVRLAGRPLEGLNDLEHVDGSIFACALWHSDIYEIDAAWRQCCANSRLFRARRAVGAHQLPGRLERHRLRARPKLVLRDGQALAQALRGPIQRLKGIWGAFARPVVNPKGWPARPCSRQNGFHNVGRAEAHRCARDGHVQRSRESQPDAWSRQLSEGASPDGPLTICYLGIFLFQGEGGSQLSAP